ncbi:hypothetical protein HAX54_026480 [Datura stramonium]|uniref:Uncharacterized protein n=1 Tax=Datura stramonium TaxID=4076 RepID=A0ABS8Y609_DATST|nr:hypothetical protein [Datura stramonium]
MDPRLEDQYSIRGARKVAKLAYQCLSQQPKSRPTMTNVVKILEPILDLKDIPIGPFVYVAPSFDCNKSGLKTKGSEEKEKEKNKVQIISDQDDKGSAREKNQLKSAIVCSDTHLYKTLRQEFR